MRARYGGMIVQGARSVIWWIRRDVRLHDNRALGAASARGGPVIPVFVLDPGVLESRLHRAASRRRAFLFGGLSDLDRELHARGSRLVVREGRPVDALAALVQETDAQVVVAEGDVSPYARRRDAAVRRAVPLELVGSPTVHHPADVLKRDGSPYTVFTPFRKAWLARPLPSTLDVPRERFEPVPDAIASATLPVGASSTAFPPGETEARRRLRAFTGGAHAAINRYATDRNRLDVAGTSALSPYLRFGMVSPREAVLAAVAAGADVWLSELVWREFYQAILFHFPDVLRGAFDARFQTFGYRRDGAALAAWQRGTTGYPIVDAAMRQLAQVGWMHNRARMIVASFLTKHLLLDWREGEAWFMQQLIDGDPAANNGGWQWTAGVGTDAAPYFRVFNPIVQAKKFDPDGAYVRRWLPELRRVHGAAVHEPWTLSPIEQRAAGCVIGRDYPAPLVEHHPPRARALAAYRQARMEAT